jgi:hypothetical protein
VHTLFQGYALFPHLSVWDNVAFAPRLAGQPEAALRALVAALLADVGSRRGCTRGRRRRCRAGSASGWRWRGRWRGGRDAAARRAAGGAGPAAARGAAAAAQGDAARREIGFLHVTHEPEEAMALADHAGADGARRGARAGRAGGALREAAGPGERAAARRPDAGAGRAGRWLRPERLRRARGCPRGQVRRGRARGRGRRSWRWRAWVIAGRRSSRSDGQRLLVRGLTAPTAGAGAWWRCAGARSDELGLGDGPAMSGVSWSSTSLAARVSRGARSLTAG